MRINTSDLTGAALDWAVAKALGMHTLMARGGFPVFDSDAFAEYRNDYNDDKLQRFCPSTDWAQGGPIIERERITLAYGESEEDWFACIGDSRRFDNDTPDGLEKLIGPTPLIAAMRCYVISKLGDEVEIPGELK